MAHTTPASTLRGDSHCGAAHWSRCRRYGVPRAHDYEDERVRVVGSTTANTRIDHSGGLDTFEDLPSDGKCVRVCIIPRWAGHADSDWYPWIREALSQSHPAVSVTMLTLPHPSAPTIADCLASLRSELGDRIEDLRDTLLVGHSVGNHALMRHLVALPPSEARGGALLCVAGWWTIDQPWPTLLPWLEPFEHTRVRGLVRSTSVLLGDDDPFTRDYSANRARWQSDLGADVEVVPGAKHFNGAREPSVLARVRALLG